MGTAGTTRDRLEVYTNTHIDVAIRAQALGALYIGDRLRELTRAINRAANPTGPDLDQRFEQAVTDVTERIWVQAINKAKEKAAGGDKKAYCPRCQSHNLGGIPDDTPPRSFDDPAIWRCLTCKYEGPRDAFYHEGKGER